MTPFLPAAISTVKPFNGTTFVTPNFSPPPWMSKPCGHDEHAEGGSQQVQAGFDKGSLAFQSFHEQTESSRTLFNKIIPSYFQLQVVLSQTEKLWKDNWTKEPNFFHKSFKDSQLCDFSWGPRFLQCDVLSVIYRTNPIENYWWNLWNLNRRS